MTTAEWLSLAETQLTKVGIGTPRLDALVLLEDITGRDRTHLLAHPETELLSKDLAKLKKLLRRRAKHEPLAYVRGHTEFYGRDFVITPTVLVPRPESETMIDLLKTLPDLSETPSILDIGTGSGSLGITAQLELPGATVTLSDISVEALEIAKTNVDKFTLNISTLEMDLLGDNSLAYDVLLCNLPYVPDEYQINQAAGFEPRLAIFGGLDGLDLYRRLFDQVLKAEIQPLYILTESLPSQHQTLKQIAQEANYILHLEQDFIQVFRFVNN